MKTGTKKTETKQTKTNDDVAQLTDIEINAVSGAGWGPRGMRVIQIQMQ